jgi:NADPH-dependent curcumin reductase CurA
VKVLYAAVDPGMRGWLSSERNYMTVENGEVMRALGVGRVMVSSLDDYRAGDDIVGWFGWQEFAAVEREAILWKADTDLAPAATWLSAFGFNGLTAWVGFCHFGRPIAGETALVSTAAGGVGGVVGQLAREHEVRAVGLTSSTEKIELATTKLGYERAINYREISDLSSAIGTACPDGVDIFFDNAGGSVADAVFPHLNTGARVIQCGTASIASWVPWPSGPRRERDVLVKRLSWHGFMILDHSALYPEALSKLKALWKTGALTSRHHVLAGLAEAPTAIELLYRGENHGRLLVRIDDEAES